MSQALSFRYRLRNQLVRLHLAPVLTKGERAYARGYQHGMGLAHDRRTMLQVDIEQLWRFVELAARGGKNKPAAQELRRLAQSLLARKTQTQDN